MKQVLTLLLFILSISISGAEKPNFLFIISDDQAPTTIAALGNKEIKTPNLDSLVKRGTAFSNCFNQGSWSGAVCVASRTMLITGQSVYKAPQNTAYLHKWAYAKKDLAPTRETAVPLWPKVFRDAGYHTFLTGKWHNNDDSVLIGFDQADAYAEGMYETRDASGSKAPGYKRPTPENNHWKPWDPQFTGHWAPFVKDINKDGAISDAYTVEQHTSELFADKAVNYLETAAKRDQPFFMYVAFNAPHDPRQAPKKFTDQYQPENTSIPKNYLPEHPFNNGAIKIRDEVLAPHPRTKDMIRTHRAEYNAIIAHMDHEIGRILKALEATGKADNTYIIFTSDHGLAVGSHGLLGKQNPYDHSIKMPFIICGPDIPENRRIDNKIYMQSAYPTTCELAGLEIPETVDYPSVKKLATGETDKGGEDIIYGTYLEFQRLVRTDKHKLIFYPKLDRYQLFDLA
ncbi:sulfatase-like hydrolase/transferase, partial [bacterium]|nr:sulfatase-like hydrolase/transferase [bacterium]